MKRDLFRKCVLVLIMMGLPCATGAILSHYLAVAWSLLLGICLGLLLLGVYWYFACRFSHIDVDIHTLEAKLNELKEKMGTAIGNKLSWHEFWSKVRELISKIEGSGFNPDVVLCIGRSGAVVGGMIATNLNSTKCIGLDRLVVLQDRDGATGMQIELDKSLIANTDVLKNKKVLCVMSECETGLTLSQIHKSITQTIPGIVVKTAVLFKRKKVHFSPDYVVLSSDQWPELPFRIEDKWRPNHPQLDHTIKHDIQNRESEHEVVSS